MEKQKVGVVEHYYDHLGVAVVNLSAPLRLGDKIEIMHADGKPVLEETVDSMQVEHNQIQEAKPGDAVGLKVKSKVHRGNVVYKA